MTTPADRELLEMAAKAAGIHGFWADTGINTDSCVRPTIWNPLANDGDALRLAVKLKMILCVREEGKTDATVKAWSGGVPWNTFLFDHDDDPYAATRRAIVRAAAEIGKELP